MVRRTLLGLSLVCACHVDRGLDDVPVDQGIYGRITTDGRPLAGVDIGVFLPGTPPRLFSVGTSNGEGVFDLDAYDQVLLCVLDARPCVPDTQTDACCTLVTVPDGKTRQDCVMSEAGGHWCAGPCND